MRVMVQGKKDGKRLRYTYDPLDYYNKEEKATSMSRTTGFPCAIVARLIVKGKYAVKGISPPEYLGKEHEVYHKILKELAKRNIIYRKNIIEI